MLPSNGAGRPSAATIVSAVSDAQLGAIVDLAVAAVNERAAIENDVIKSQTPSPKTTTSSPSGGLDSHGAIPPFGAHFEGGLEICVVTSEDHNVGSFHRHRPNYCEGYTDVDALLLGRANAVFGEVSKCPIVHADAPIFGPFRPVGLRKTIKLGLLMIAGLTTKDLNRIEHNGGRRLSPIHGGCGANTRASLNYLVRKMQRMNQTILGGGPARSEGVASGQVNVLIIDDHSDFQRIRHFSPKEKAPPVPEDGGEQYVQYTHIAL